MNPRGRPSRFWTRVDVRGPDECWPWTGSINSWGYGAASYGNRTAAASRVVLLKAGVEVPPGMYVCHHCDNPACCNPAHLYVGTPADNARDREKRGRRDIRGERNSAAKLTRAQADRIREDRRSGPVIAAEYGVTRATINNIRRGDTWL